MSLNREENYKYRKASLIILAKALDDICPKYEEELPENRKQLIQDRIQLFKYQEKELDREWRDLNKEATDEVKRFNRARQLLIKKIQKTDKAERIQKKVRDLELKKQHRVTYLKQKETEFEKQTNAQLKDFLDQPKKQNQLNKKLKTYLKSSADKIQKSCNRYDAIITNVLKSDNSEKVKERLEHSKEVWDRKYVKLKNKFDEKVLIYENKRFEQDQIRLSVQAFEEDSEKFKHWCLMAGITMRTCYLQVIERLRLIGRESEVINELLKQLTEEGEEKLL